MEKSRKFSIITAAKNESENLSALINSLECIDYPKDCFELIIVDDDSEDDTKLQLNKISASSTVNIICISSENKRFPAKKGALDLGISHASNEFILITDADCRPSPGWLKHYSDVFEDYDFLFGPAPFYQTNNPVNQISCFENLRSSLLVNFFAKNGLPYSASARNFGFRKSAFYNIKGYENTTETLSGDDDLLLREAVKHKMRIGCIDNPEAAVFSFTKTTLRDYLKQKKRHTKTSVYYLPQHQILLGIWHITNILMLLAPLLFYGSTAGPLLFLIKLLFDTALVKYTEKKYSYKFSILSIPILQIIYEHFLVFNFINALLGKDEWK